jgi:hypothetical protein
VVLGSMELVSYRFIPCSTTATYDVTEENCICDSFLFYSGCTLILVYSVLNVQYVINAA